MESVGEVEDVGVGEADRLRHVLLESGSRVENELDPSLGSLMSNVVLQWSSDLTLASKGTVNKSIQQRGFESRHFSSRKFIITDQSFSFLKSMDKVAGDHSSLLL